MKKALMILSATALLAIVSALPASAQSSTRPIDKSTLLTFSGPVSLPDVTLPAGTYLFKFADPINAPDVLMVMSQDATTPYAMLHTIPIVRTETVSNNSEIVTFRETPANEPPAINAWYFDASESAPGWQDVGCELVYSK
jgi:hypothetical protein